MALVSIAAMKTTSEDLADRTQVEALRYALMRRIAPVLRHQLVGSLQPLGLVSQVLKHKLRADTPDVAVLADSAERAVALVRGASATSNEVMSWLSSDADVAVAVGDCIAQCVAGLHTSLSFHGFALRQDGGLREAPVQHLAAREVLTAALLACADHAQGRSEISIGAREVDGLVQITLAVREGAGASRADEGAYRALQWDEVEALARSHGMRLDHAVDPVVLTMARAD